MYLNVRSYAEVWSDQQYLATLNIERTGSSIVVDRANIARRTGTLTLTDPNAGTANALVPTTSRSLLAPFGNELRCFYGIQYDDGTTEDIAVGVLQIVNPVTVNDGDLNITITATDRSRAYSRAGFQDVFVIAPNTNLALAVQAILQQCNVGFTELFNFSPTTFVTPSTSTVYEPGDDPWAKATTLCSDNGFELFHDPDGVCIFQPVPDPRQAAIAFRYDYGDENLALKITRSLDTTDAPNFIICNGEGGGVAAPVKGVAFDDNADSPMYVNGKYGTVVSASTSSLLVNQQQADLSSASKLFLSIGTVETVEMVAVPKPDHDVDDVIEVTDPDSGIASGSLYVIDSLTLTFGDQGSIDMKTRGVTPLS